jgi:hypothetical protein
VIHRAILLPHGQLPLCLVRSGPILGREATIA